MTRTTSAAPAATSPDDARFESPARHPDRLHVLDVLRGIALMGMFLVHFTQYASGGNRIDRVYESIVALFFEERFWAMFGILFGVGFAIQLRRAESRREDFMARYLRRLAGLAVFGLVAHAVFGFNVLLGYAIWGLPLLLVRRWPVRLLIAGVLLSAASGNVYSIARAANVIAKRGEAAYRVEREASVAADRVFRQANREAQDAAAYPAVFSARLKHVRWFYVQWFSFLPANTFTLFLLGVLGLRLGLFDRPDQHRRLIAALMVFGVASWAATYWLLPTPSAEPGTHLLRALIVARLQRGFGLVRDMWLAFAYIGAVLLLVARNSVWLRRLSAFGWAGRMALTNYMIQIAILDLSFARYALGLSLTPLTGLLAALALFLANAAFSRWWLTRYRFGPLEWLWRSMTRWRWQPWRVEAQTERPLAVVAR